MTLREKFWQLYMSPGSLDDPAHDYAAGAFGLQIDLGGRVAGPPARAHAERINRIQQFFVERTRLGIPIIAFEEALHGLAREGATVFPQAIALAATWDTALAGRVAAAAARETRARGIRQVLSPVVNLATDVRWGRVEETYGEDPRLASLMGRVFVHAFETAGVITTPKHFVANVGEGGRDSYPIALSRRELEEYHFPPFRAALAAGAGSVMTAYNSVDGTPATQHPWLLGRTLKQDWGFPGFVISDAAATGGAVVLHHTAADVPSAAAQAWRAGLDVIFQSSWPQHRPYLEAVESGKVPTPVLDSAVLRVLRAKFALGLFEQPFVNPDSAAWWNGSAAHLALAREAARASMVLLRNEAGLLPLSPATRSIAVIGMDAAAPRLGGYSGPGIAPVSILQGLRQRFPGDHRVRFAAGPGRTSPQYHVIPEAALRAGAGDTTGLMGQYFDNVALTGTPRVVRRDARIDFGWTWNQPAPGIPNDWYSVRWSGTIEVPTGVRRVGVEGTDGYRLWIDGRLVIDNWRRQSYRALLVDVMPGRHEIRLEFFESAGNGRVKLVWDSGVPDPEPPIREAAELAKQCEVAVVVAGIEEGEFRDRAFLGLPGHQEELIRAVARTGTPVVVVLVGGSAITMSGWLDQVDAVLMAWYPGEQGGHAVADLLLGDASPAGRLPMTWPVAEGQLPLRYNHAPTGRGDDYLDLTGQPLFPFGYGLSYTRFEYSGLAIDAPGGPDDPVMVRLQVTNVGDRTGDEVVQLYLRDLLASVARPVIQLAAFRRVRLAPGTSQEIELQIEPEQLALVAPDLRLIREPGAWRVMVGASSRDIRLRGTFTLR